MCFALYEFRDRQSSYCATVYLEDFIDFWKHLLAPELFLPFPPMENWSSFSWIFQIFQWKRQHLIMLLAPTLRSWVYQCLGDCSQSSPGSRRHGDGGEAHGEEEEMPGVKKGAVRVEMEKSGKPNAV